MTENDKKPKVSIITASYNYENYIRETIESVINQTFQDWEMIIVDDGSTDNSISVIREYCEKDNRIKLYTHPNNENRGLSETIQFALSKAKSEWVAFLESDDYWSNDYLEEKFNYIEKNRTTSVLINDIKTVGKDDKDSYVSFLQDYYINRKYIENDFKVFDGSANGIATFSTIMIKKKILLSLDFNSPITAWLDWWLTRQIAVIYPIHFVDLPLTYWRIHGNSYNSDGLQQDVKNFKKLSNKLLTKNFGMTYLKLKFNSKEFLQNIFSLKNNSLKTHKIIKILGFEFQIKRKIYSGYKKYKVKNKKSACIISQELSYSGAPIVLLPLISYLQKKDMEVVVLSIRGGKLVEDLKRKKIKTFLISDIYNQQEDFINFAKQFNIVFCNTLITSPFVYLLNKFQIKFIWWIHESFSIVEYINDTPIIKGILPPLETLQLVQEVFTESNYAKKMFISKFNKNAKILPYGIPDKSKEYSRRVLSKTVFTTVGSFAKDKRKGQDILIEAIKQLPTNYQEKIIVDFVGKCTNRQAREYITATKHLPFVNFKGLVHFDNKNELYKNTDVLVCVSRDDPFPVVVSEAMSFSIPCIVSENVGQAELITNYYDGLIVRNEDIEQLKNTIMWCVDNREKLPEIGKNSRKIYEKHMSIENFEKEIEKIL